VPKAEIADPQERAESGHQSRVVKLGPLIAAKPAAGRVSRVNRSDEPKQHKWRADSNEEANGDHLRVPAAPWAKCAIVTFGAIPAQRQDQTNPNENSRQWL
jgi:hypothetical protein